MPLCFTTTPLSAALLVLLLFADLVSAQSLGEIARKEEERRKTIKSSGKVYTNESLKPAPAPPPPPAGSPAPAAREAVPPSPSGAQPAPGAQSSPGGQAQAPPEPKKDEAYWRDRLKAERDALARAQIFAEALQSRINALTADFAARDDPAQRDVIALDRQKALAELDRVKQEIQQHTKAIAAIQEEARRAGVPAGWVR